MRVIVLLVFILMLLPTSIFATTAAVPKTGQITSYVSGDDGDIQAGISWPDPRFSVLGDGTVADNLTGLIWSQEPSASTFGSCTGGMLSWQEALDYVACLNNNSHLGYDDWLLPNVNELKSLIDIGSPLPTIPEVSPFGIFGGRYWTSTTYARNQNSAQVVDFGQSNVYSSYNKTMLQYVWPMRSRRSSSIISLPRTGQTISYASRDDGALQLGVAWTASRFIDNRNGTVTDSLTGLIWLKNAGCFNEQSWNTALTSANNLSNGSCGLTDGSSVGDWRLPNRNELLSLVDYSYTDPAISQPHAFTGPNLGRFWSSSANDTNYAWYISLWSGEDHSIDMTNDLYVLPVRGQTLQPEPLSTPAAPQLSYLATGLDLSISWTPVSNATGYTLYYAPFPYIGPDSIGSFDMLSATSFSINLWEGAAYYIAVTARNAVGESHYSNIESFTITNSARNLFEPNSHEYTPDFTKFRFDSYAIDQLGFFGLNTIKWRDSNYDPFNLNNGYTLYRRGVNQYGELTDWERLLTLDYWYTDSEWVYTDPIFLNEGWLQRHYRICAERSGGLGTGIIYNYGCTGQLEFSVPSDLSPTCIDNDADGYSPVGGDCGEMDCNDTLDNIHPGQIDICDGIDNNCDLVVDEDCVGVTAPAIDTFTYSDTENYFLSYGKTLIETSNNDLLIGVKNKIVGQPGIMLLSSNGVPKWEKTYSDATNFKVIKETQDGGFIMCGTGGGTVDNRSSFSIIIKADSFGNVVWRNQYDYTYSEEARDVIQTNDGGYVVLGNYANPDMMPSNSSVPNYWLGSLSKFDSRGALLWQKTINQEDSTILVSVTEEGNGDITAIGISRVGDQQSELVVSLNSRGNVLWSRVHHDTTGWVYLEDAVATIDGGYLAVGSIYYGTSRSILLVKFDDNGNLVFRREFHNSISFKGANSIISMQDGGYLIAGRIYSTGYMLKVDTQGDMVFERKWSTPDWLLRAIEANDGGIITIDGDRLYKFDRLGLY